MRRAAVLVGVDRTGDISLRGTGPELPSSVPTMLEPAGVARMRVAKADGEVS